MTIEFKNVIEKNKKWGITKTTDTNYWLLKCDTCDIHLTDWKETSAFDNLKDINTVMCVECSSRVENAVKWKNAMPSRQLRNMYHDDALGLSE